MKSGMVWDFKVKGRGREGRAKRRVFSFEENSICKELAQRGSSTQEQQQKTARTEGGLAEVQGLARCGGKARAI